MSTRSSRPRVTTSLRRWGGEETQNDFNLEEECIERKTVTTITTIQRSYPSIQVRPSRPLKSLDVKEYPLAQTPTPAEISQFSYQGEGGTRIYVREGGRSTAAAKNQEADSSRFPARNDHGDTDSGTVLQTAGGRGPESSIAHIKINPGRTGSHIKIMTGKSLSAANPPQLRSAPSSQPRSEMFERSGSLFGHLPATPDASELNTPDQNAPSQSWPSFPASDSQTGHSILDQHASLADDSSWIEAPSPTSEPFGNSFNTAVATPPIAESDLEPLDRADTELSTVSSCDHTKARHLLDKSGSSNASLPSPRLSPTLAAAKLNLERPRSNHGEMTGLPITKDMIETFDTMSDEMKTFMMYKFLQRCPRKTLHTIANVISPALKCDFLDRLPLELTYHILGFLKCKDLCRAAQVSRKWRNIIDQNETGWKDLMDRDGFMIPAGELQRAIVEGWGWQDANGPESCEKDISGRTDENNAGRPSDWGLGPESGSRTLKRKRNGTHSADRAKRRTLSSRKNPDLRKQAASLTDPEKVHRSEGPSTAASAAALAVPNPEVELPQLRELHLFKSLYRRHYMIQRNWTNREVKPLHIAFPAHPRFVITCLQFDDDKILTGSDDTFIHVYDTKTGALRKRLEGHEGGVWALQYEGNVLVSGSTDRSVRVWDIEKGLCTQVFHGHTSTVRCLQILMPSPTGIANHGKEVMMPAVPLIITGSRDSQLRVWRLPEQGEKRYLPGPGANDTDCPFFLKLLTGHTHSVRAIAAHGDTLVSGSYDHSVRVWRISTGETVHRLTGHQNKVYSIVLDKDRNRCISGSMDFHVRIWSLETGSCLYTLEGHTSLVGLLDLYDGRLVSAAADSTLRIWDPENGECKHTLTAHTAAITCFQHDSTKVISGSDRTLKMWNVKTGECTQDLLTDLSGVWQVRFDQRRCVAAVQRNGMTYIEILDFGAVRDGVPSNRRGCRILVDGRSSSLGREEIATSGAIGSLDEE